MITGGSRGIGRCIAQQFADEGANLALCARGVEALDEVAVELRARGVEVFTQACDASDPAALDGFLSGRGLANDVDAQLGIEKRPDAGAEDRVIIGEQYLHESAPAFSDGLA